MSARSVLLVFARQWDAGPVKTRLAATIGQERATALYKRLAETVWSRLAHAADERWLLVEPPHRVDAAAAWLPGADRVLGQSTGDLGDRLQSAFAQAFAEGAERVAAVGTDAPALDAVRVREAFHQLAESDVALVPALDGGYALLALRQPAPELFRGIPWSGELVCEQTRQKARSSGLIVADGPAVRDLDTAEDLAALVAEGWEFET